MFNLQLPDLLSSIVAIVIAISVHEFGHAFVAYLFGDDTARNQGRMSFNPARHLDPVGILAMIVFHIGWARPVPVNPNNFKNYKLANFCVSIAGVTMNVIFAMVGALVYKYVHFYAINLIAQYTIIYNLVFASFNLLPIPPLDGWSLISTFLPYKLNYYASKIERYSFIIFVVMIMTNAYTVFVNPVYQALNGLVMLLV